MTSETDIEKDIWEMPKYILVMSYIGAKLAMMSQSDIISDLTKGMEYL